MVDGWSDRGFYLLVGTVTIVLFALGLGALALRNPDVLTGRSLFPFAVGFLVFMGVYVVSYAIRHLEDAEG